MPTFDWKDVVAKSEGSSVFLPDELLDRAKEIKKEDEEYSKILEEIVAKKELELSIKNQNLWLDIRHWLEKNGRKDIFAKDCGWNTDARKEGVFIVNISDPQRR